MFVFLLVALLHARSGCVTFGFEVQGFRVAFYILRSSIRSFKPVVQDFRQGFRWFWGRVFLRLAGFEFVGFSFFVSGFMVSRGVGFPGIRRILRQVCILEVLESWAWGFQGLHSFRVES